MTKLRSNSDLFARRGDPWVTRKQGETEFGRNLETENPDYDRIFAQFVVEKPKHVDPPPKRKREADWALKKANIIKAEKQPDPNDSDPFNRFRSKGIADE